MSTQDAELRTGLTPWQGATHRTGFPEDNSKYAMNDSGSAFNVVAAAFLAISVNDRETAAKYFSPDVRYHLINRDARHSRVLEGIDGILGLRAQVDRVTNGTYTADIHKLEAAGPELVIVHAQTRAEIDGRKGGGHWVIIARVVDGKIVQVTDTAETALDLFWRPAKG